MLPSSERAQDECAAKPLDVKRNQSPFPTTPLALCRGTDATEDFILNKIGEVQISTGSETLCPFIRMSRYFFNDLESRSSLPIPEELTEMAVCQVAKRQMSLPAAPSTPKPCSCCLQESHSIPWKLH